MEGDFLDHKLDCKSCGTIYLKIPADAEDHTAIHCSTCNQYLGTWGALQDDFAAQTADGHGAFELKDGRIQEK